VRRIALVAAVLAAACSVGAAQARSNVAGGTFTGLGMDTCTAPSLDALGAWLASPYRAAGIYVGGANRACADGNLSAAWVQSATAGGWALIPLYVGLQAPCVGDKSLKRIDPAAPGSQGRSAADDAVAKAAKFGLAPGVPLYFDMEGYSTTDKACTGVVQQFVTAWVAEVHRQGYVAGIYGSASSTIRDMIPLTASGSAPDQVDIGNWNKSPSIFGDPYVPDSYWPNHQRIHQYRGGHNETFGGVTLNMDNDALDGAVATAKPAVPTGAKAPAGSATSSDGAVTAGWPAGTLPQGGTVTLTPATLAADSGGFAAGSYTVQLTSSASSFAKPVKLQFQTAPPAGVVPGLSADGQTWTPLLRLPSARLPAKATAGYTVDGTGRVTVLTTTPAWFGLLKDVSAPTRPAAPFADLTGAPLRLYWSPSQDNSGSVATYRILRGGQPGRDVAGTRGNAAVALDPSGRSIFRVEAVDAAGNASTPSSALVVLKRQRPYGVPKTIPRWAWALLDWQSAGHAGKRPGAPHPLPAWYWRWSAWVQHPYRITPNR
jgi:hypothetical protein